MGFLFGRKSSEADKRVKKVTAYVQLSGFMAKISKGTEMIGIDMFLNHIEVLLESGNAHNADMGQKIREYLREYQIETRRVQDLPDSRDLDALQEYARKAAGRSAWEPDFAALRGTDAVTLYVIEYGRGPKGKRHAAEDRKEIAVMLQAGSPMESTYEKEAQAVRDWFEEWQKRGTLPQQTEWEQLRTVGLRINDFDRMVQVIRRAEFLCRKANIGTFSVRDVEYAWDGIAGFMR